MSANKFKWIITILAILLAVYGLIPSVLDGADGKLDRNVENYSGPTVDWFMENGKALTLGLDLQGGLLLQYGVLVEEAVQDKLERMSDDLEARLEGENSGVEVTTEHPKNTNYVDIRFKDPSNTTLITDDFMSFFPSMTQVDMGSGVVRVTMTDDYIKETKEFAVTQAVETIRERIDALGVAEPSVTRQGQNGIVVQLPGLKADDVDRAKGLIGQTAQLEFKMVDDDGTQAFFSQFQSGGLPAGFDLRRIGDGNLSVTAKDKDALIAFLETKIDRNHAIGVQYHPIYENSLEKTGVDPEASYWKSYYLFRKVDLTGEYIQDARVAVDPQFNKPYVSLTFDSRGAELFGDLSANNVGKRMAIMMGDEVQSAPVFNEAIRGGRAQITLGSMEGPMQMQRDAQDLVIVLRHGALPAPIEMQYQTVVGPTLGADSINTSLKALGVGGLLVILLMGLYYRGSGMISIGVLFLNLLFITAALAALGATLTLPGIAGVILTIGMAVDANVIIYERIREELHRGFSPYEAVRLGFDHALSAVMDGNITTAIAGLVLLQYGTGPIKGFAVTLLIGIGSTLFTAVIITRLIFDTYGAGRSRDVEKISI
ncbi:protein translocase subunit SecD [Bradymonas sediminis]|uniref:Protein translocase subunit SecD n=1 Tax=Bradymonas sediminis TaxID=1548548 RepID=A0A2Z4FLH4_9DELT|nr:protein translocase subunit SecD [Bradymonas sediminis]AWV89548.1 protein translocase subunit SecD [Bradymonas sediminis]TDP76719.1 preprotein translocase subunit SecD [Bradymonas sediminis]